MDAGVAPREAGAASGPLNSSRQIGALLGLAALVTVAHNRTGHTAVPVTLHEGYALGLTLSAALLVAAVLMALTVLRRSSQHHGLSRPMAAICSPGLTGNPGTTITVLHPVPADAADLKGTQSDDYDTS